jgi:hypothetical protein
MRVSFILLGLVLITIGGIWSLQGGGAWQGASMSGQALWLLLGLAAMIGGVLLIVLGSRPRRPRSKS